MSGWIKLHRQLMEWEWYQDSNMVHLYLHMLMKANREPKKWKGVMVEAGQFIAGRETLSFDTGISVQTIRTCIARLQESGLLTSKPTNKYTLFTLVKWGSVVNGDDITNQQTNQQLTNNQPTTNQQLTTNKNIEKDKKVKNTTPLNPLKGKRSPKKTALPTIPSELNKPVFTTAWQEWIQHRSEIDRNLTPSTATKQLQMLLPMGADHAAAVLNHSITKGWQGLFPDNVPAPTPTTPTKPEPQYFEPANRSQIIKVFPNRTDLVDTPWSELTPDVQQVITEKCKEL